MEEILVINGIKYKKIEEEKIELYDVVKYNGYEWYVIKKEDDNLTLLMKNCIDKETMKLLFDDKYLDEDCNVKFNLEQCNDWVESIIRKVLNEKFIKNFTKDELNEMNTNYDEDKYSKDYIRLLTIRETEKLPNDIRVIDEYYWTLSPSKFTSSYSSIAYVWSALPSGGLLGWSHVTNSLGARPVINLKTEYLNNIQN